MTQISFTATVYKVQTLVDSGVRVTLDLDENSIMQMAQLAECQKAGAILQLIAEIGQTDDRRNTNKRGKIHI